MFKQLPSSTAALYLQHQQSEWQRLCGTLTSHWTTVDRLTSSSHKNTLSAQKKNHSLRCGCFFWREHVFPVFSHKKPIPPERLAHYPMNCECTITAQTSRTAEPGTGTGCHHVSEWEGKISRLLSQIQPSHMDKTGSLVLPPCKGGWEPGFCQVHCMRGGWCSSTLQDWGIHSKEHLPHLPASMSYIQQCTEKKVMHLPFCSSGSALLLCPKTPGRDKS